MKKINFILLIISCSLNSMNIGKLLSSVIENSAEDSYKIFEVPIKGNRLKTKDIRACDSIEINNSFIDGAMLALKSVLLNNSTVKGKLKALGFIAGHKSIFEDDLEGQQYIRLSNVMTKNIYMTDKTVNKIIIQGKSIVAGIIHFESENFSLCISPQTTIIGGVKCGNKIICRPIINGQEQDIKRN